MQINFILQACSIFNHFESVNPNMQAEGLQVGEMKEFSFREAQRNRLAQL